MEMRKDKDWNVLLEEEGLIKFEILLKDENRFNESGYEVPNKEEVSGIIEYLDVNPNNLYYYYSDLISFLYYIDEKNFNYIRLDTTSLEDMQFIKSKIRLDKLIQISRAAFEDGNYLEMISLVEKKYQIEAFIRLLNLYKSNKIIIKDEDMFEIFECVYTDSEFGFSEFDRKDISLLLSLNSNNSYKARIEKDDNGYVTIYRGQGDESSSLDEALSWTLDKDKAEWFADRFDTEDVGIVYQAKTHIDNINAYFEDRGEEEVIVFPEDVVNLKIALDKSCC